MGRSVFLSVGIIIRPPRKGKGFLASGRSYLDQEILIAALEETADYLRQQQGRLEK